MLEAADKLTTASPRAMVFDKKRKGELAAKLSQRWQRWELSNFDYLMQVGPHHCRLISSAQDCFMSSRLFMQILVFLTAFYTNSQTSCACRSVSIDRFCINARHMTCLVG